MVITLQNTNIDLAIAPPLNIFEIGNLSIDKTSRYKIDLFNFVGIVKYGAAFGAIDDTTIGVGSLYFDKAFEIVVDVNGVEQGSIRVDGIGNWSLNPLYLDLNRFDDLRIYIRIYSVISELEFAIGTLSVLVEEFKRGYEVIQPQLLNLEDACFCDKIGIGSTFSAQLRTKKISTKGSNLVTNSSFNPNDGFDDWTAIGNIGVRPEDREVVLIGDVGDDGADAIQTIALTKGTYFISFDMFMELPQAEIDIDGSYVDYSVRLKKTTLSEPTIQWTFDKNDITNNNVWNNRNYTFEIDEDGDYDLILNLNSNVASKVGNFGFDNIYLHNITQDATASISEVQITDCEGTSVLDCQLIPIGGGDYNNDYNDDYFIEPPTIIEECTIKEIQYVDAGNNYLQAIINIDNPTSGEFSYTIIDSEGNEFVTPLFYIPVDCQEHIKVSNFNRYSFIISSEAEVNEYYLRGYIGTLTPFDSERVSHEQSDGSIIDSYYRGYKKAELTIGVYSGDAHIFFNRLLSIGNLQVDDKDFVIEKGAKYEINDLNNGTGVGKIDLTPAKSGFITLN